MEYFLVNARLDSFFTAALLLAALPGPDNLFVLSQSALHGWRAGLLVTLGLCTGLAVHTSLVGLGIAALLVSYPAALRGLKIAGVIYLLYLAWAAWQAGSTVAGALPANRLSGARLYGRGIVMNVTNPKVFVFFLAFLPQFLVQGSLPVFVQVSLLGLMFAIATLLVFGGFAIFAGHIGDRYRQDSDTERRLHNIAAAVLFMIAMYLLVSN